MKSIEIKLIEMLSQNKGINNKEMLAILQKKKKMWKSIDNFYREGQHYHVYIGEINHIGGTSN